MKYKYFSDSDEKIHLLVKIHYLVYIIMLKNWQVYQGKIIYSTISFQSFIWKGFSLKELKEKYNDYLFLLIYLKVAGIIFISL